MCAACGDDEKKPTTSTPRAGASAPKDASAPADVCPDAVGDGEAWAYAGGDDECKQLAEGLTASAADNDDEGDPCEPNIELTSVDNKCRGTAASSCDGRSVALDCDVSSAGKAVCKATITAPELSAGKCELTLTVGG